MLFAHEWLDKQTMPVHKPYESGIWLSESCLAELARRADVEWTDDRSYEERVDTSNASITSVFGRAIKKAAPVERVIPS